MQYLLEQRNSFTKLVYNLLIALNVKVSKTSIKEELENHPDYPSILSISDALKAWKVDNFVIQADKQKLTELPTPFIAYLKSNQRPFITVANVNASEVAFLPGSDLIKQRIEDFLNDWTGITLVAEATSKSGEKNYHLNRRLEIIQSLKLPLVISAVLALTAFAAIFQYSNPTTFSAFTVLLFLKLAGCAVTTLLLWYEIDKANPVLKQICGVGKQSKCSVILNSKQSKLFNTISWSEIGFLYFLGGFISLLTTGVHVINVLYVIVWLNIFALPYTLFSIYYQWKIAKQWCVLCLTVQVVLVAEFLTAVTAQSLLPLLITSQLGVFPLPTVISVLSSFLIPTIAWFLIKPLLLENQEANRRKRELLRFKYDSRIFETLLQKQKQITIDPKGLGITIGNPEATNTIIKVCNPYCGPCAKAHPTIDALLENNNDIKVQILFTTTNAENDRANKPVKHLLAVASEHNKNSIKRALNDWYLADKKNYDVFAAKYPMDGELKQQDAKIDAMSYWCKETGITFTPTFFINGYQLPDVYNINDIKYFLST